MLRLMKLRRFSMLIAVSSSDVEEKDEKEEAEHLIVGIVFEFDDGLNEKNLLLVMLKLESFGSDEGSETEQ